MTELALPLRSNPGVYKLSGAPRLVNCYAERQGDDNKAPYAILPVPGLAAFGSELPGPCRGMIYLIDDVELYSVNGFYLYQITSSGTKTSKGLVPGTGKVWLARNNATNTQLMVVAEGQVKVLESGTFTGKVYHSGFTPLGVVEIGGYFILWQADGKVYASDLLSTDITSTNFQTAESSPDGLTFCHSQGKLLYLVGTDTIEIWSISGGSGFPLTPLGSATIEVGSTAPKTAQDFQNGFAFVGNDNQVHLITDYTDRVISNDEVSRLIEGEDHDDLVALTWRKGANEFYTLHGPTWTREYNARTGFWVDRETGIGAPWRPGYHASAFGLEVYGDRFDGNHYTSSSSLFTENGEILAWTIETSIFHDFPNGIEFNRIDLDVETGDGISASTAGYAMLSWSDDDKRSWRGPRHMSLGKKGEYTKALTTHMLGQCGRSGRSFRFSITDPVIRAINMIDVQAQPVRL